MGQVPFRSGTGPFLGDVEITLCKGVRLHVVGKYTAGEPNVGLWPQFHMTSASVVQGNLLDVIDWADAQHGRALQKVEELCIEKENER